MKKRVGQLHGIDLFLPNRPTKNTVVYCPAPACPEPGVNMTQDNSSLPNELRPVFSSLASAHSENYSDTSGPSPLPSTATTDVIDIVRIPILTIHPFWKDRVISP